MGSKGLSMKGGLPGAAMLLTLAGGLSCASAGEGSTGSRGRGDITSEEIQATSVDDAMEVISLLRPQWMQGRSAGATIVINGQRSTRNRLATIPVGSIVRIEFMSASDATTRFGTGFFDGAIVVTLR